MAVVDESGEVHIISLNDGKNLQALRGENVDNIFSVDFKSGIILTGGQDRRVGVYDLNHGMKYYKNASFFVYGVGLSPSGKIGAYSCDMDNNVELFSIQTKESLGKFLGTKMVVNSVNFINEKEFFINSSAHSVGYYKIDK
jgi:WD40 repeat protein